MISCGKMKKIKRIKRATVKMMLVVVIIKSKVRMGTLNNKLNLKKKKNVSM
jgi:hypothetical protein